MTPRNDQDSRAGGPALFALRGSRPLGQAVADHLGVPLEAHEERDFEDGEHKIRPLAEVQGRDVYVLHGLYGGPDESANDKLCKLLFFLATLRDLGAARITAIAPYLCYARKDRRTKPHDPVTTRYVAQLFEAVGVDAVVTLDVHNLAAFENAFRCRTEHLEAQPLFADEILRLPGHGGFAVVSPDVGGAKRAEAFRLLLEARQGDAVEKAFMDKRRSEGVVSGDLFVGRVEGRVAIIIDDLISTGGTLVRAAEAARRNGASAVVAVATHGLFMEGARPLLECPAIDRIVVTDSVPPFRLDPIPGPERLTVLPTAPLFAEAIRRLHRNEPLVELSGWPDRADGAAAPGRGNSLPPR